MSPDDVVQIKELLKFLGWWIVLVVFGVRMTGWIVIFILGVLGVEFGGEREEEDLAMVELIKLTREREERGRQESRDRDPEAQDR